MVFDCEEQTITLNNPAEMAGIGIELYEAPTEDSCKLSFTSSCWDGSRVKYINRGRTKPIACRDPTDGSWEYKYVRYNSPTSVDVKICKVEVPEEPTPCPDHTTQTACEAAGCFWYNDGCHSQSAPPPEGDLTDYERIKTDVDSALDPVNTALTVINGLIIDVETSLSGVSDTITGAINGLSGTLTQGINDILNLIGSIEFPSLEGLETGVSDIIESIEGLSFPTLDSIKGAFLDVCADLAASLWDAILNKIEERYPKDDEESD